LCINEKNDLLRFLFQLKKIFFLFFILLGCSQNEDFVFKTEGISIFYSDKNDSIKVHQIADYWKKNNLTSSKHQYIRLYHQSDSLYHLQLILNKDEDVKDLTYKDLSLIQDLENDLNKHLFVGSTVKIKITDKSFNELKLFN